MTNIKAIAATALSLIATLTPTAALANNVDSAHFALGKAVTSTGITLKINPQLCFTRRAMGWYSARRNELVICQENATKANVEVNWTAEDFDTLRHEAHHLAQDCRDGRTQGLLHFIYKNPAAFVKSTLSTRSINRIIDSYASKGERIVALELEAFAVAAVNDPREQVRDIQNYCL